MKSHNKHRNFIGILISLLCLAFIATRIDLDDLRIAFVDFQWAYLFLGVCSLAGGYAMRIARWSVLLNSAGAQISPIACTAPFLGSIALNNVFPMRLGDVVRALVFPSAIGVGKVTATGSLVMERLVDLMTLLVCLMIGLVFSSKTQLPDWMASTALSLAVSGGIALALLFFYSDKLSLWCADLASRSSIGCHPNRVRLFTTLRDLLDSFDAMSRLSVLVTLFALSMLVWIGEAGLFWSLLQGFGFETGPEVAIVVMAIATLSTLVPSSPGYVGPFHLAAYAAISMLGGTPGQAASFAIVSHLGVWLPTTLVGILAILLNPQLFSGLKTEAVIN